MDVAQGVFFSGQDIGTRQKNHRLVLGENFLHAIVEFLALRKSRSETCCSISRSISASQGVAGCACDGFQRCVPPLDSQTFRSGFGSVSKLASPSTQASYSLVCVTRSIRERNSIGTTCTCMPSCFRSS